MLNCRITVIFIIVGAHGRFLTEVVTLLFICTTHTHLGAVEILRPVRSAGLAFALFAAGGSIVLMGTSQSSNHIQLLVKAGGEALDPEDHSYSSKQYQAHTVETQMPEWGILCWLSIPYTYMLV